MQYVAKGMIRSSVNVENTTTAKSANVRIEVIVGRVCPLSSTTVYYVGFHLHTLRHKPACSKTSTQTQTHVHAHKHTRSRTTKT